MLGNVPDITVNNITLRCAGRAGTPTLIDVKQIMPETEFYMKEDVDNNLIIRTSTDIKFLNSNLTQDTHGLDIINFKLI